MQSFITPLKPNYVPDFKRNEWLKKMISEVSEVNDV